MKKALLILILMFTYSVFSKPNYNYIPPDISHDNNRNSQEEETQTYSKQNIWMIDLLVYGKTKNPYSDIEYGNGASYTLGEVYQIISKNEVLLRVMNGQGPIIYLKTDKASILEPYDRFYPFLPVKYLGKYYSYKNYLGGSVKVPMFREILPKEYNRLEAEHGVLKEVYIINSQDPYSQIKEFRNGY